MLVFVCITLLAFHINNKKKEIFIQSNTKQLEKSINIVIDLEANRLQQVCFDYSFWDEMVNFIQKKNLVWVKDNIDPVLNTFSLDAIWIFDKEKRLTYFTAKDNRRFDNYQIDDSIFNALYNKKFVKYYTKTPYGILEVFGASVHPSNDPHRQTQPKGYLFIARLIDENLLLKLSVITGTKITFTEDTLHQPDSKRKYTISINIPYYSSENKVITYLHAEKYLDFLRQYNNASLQYVYLFYLSVVILFISLLLVTSRWINRPLKIVESVLESENVDEAKKLEKFGREFVKIGELITAYISQKKTLEVLKSKAEESDRLKSAFMANMSHEIRTPLNGILGFTELICKSVPADDTISSYKKIVKNCSSDLLHLINAILDFSKIEAGQLVLINEPFLVYSVINELSNSYSIRKVLLAQKGVELTFNYAEGDDIELFNDKRRIKQILTNLLDNAIKFTDSGNIELGFFKKENRVVFFVKDTGIGISADMQQAIFKRFWQAAQPNSKVYGGTGLGLALCKGLATLMGGDIIVNSEIGIGSTFYVEIPIKLELSSPEGTQRVERI